jgi:cupin superfamily acireductone dioxygenase involved in methionine salvage
VRKKRNKRISGKPAGKVSDLLAEYGNTIHVFNSFDEQEEFHRKEMAALTPRELLSKLEEMRKIFLKEYLHKDGKWPAIKKIIRFKKANPL